MKSFLTYTIEQVKKPTGELKDACWTGYTAVGTKEKNGKTVPNCVPESVMNEASVAKLHKDLAKVVDAIESEFYDRGHREELANEIKEIDPLTKSDKGWSVSMLKKELRRLIQMGYMSLIFVILNK